MKTLTTLFLLGITSCYGQHQRVEFPDSGATLRYLLITKWVGHFTAMTVDFRHVKDTMVFDHNGDRWMKTTVFEGDSITNGYQVFVAKDTNRVIWNGFPYRSRVNLSPWFDCTKLVGERHFDDLVTKIDIVKSQGIARKRMYINYSKEPTFIEGIGAVEGFLHQDFYNGLISKMELLCFSVNDTVTYVNPKYGTCDTSWDINLSYSELSVIPDRMVSLKGSQIWVETPDEWRSLDLNIQVFDVRGKLLRSESLNDSRAEIPIEMRNGVYLYLLTASDQPIERGKLLLAR